MKRRNLILSSLSGIVLGVLIYQVSKNIIISVESNDDIDTKEESY
ncbi:hypothetical protein [Staphylococcus phage vB_SsapH-Golestan-100]|nr:hypothetical protein [Staphylococcus phage vB_SsapH-Golestan-100]